MKRCFGVFAFLTLAAPAFAGEVPEKALEEQAHPAGAVSEVTLAGCLPASAYVKIPVKAGQKVFVTSKIAAFCDSRGWTNGNGLAFYGPAGSGTYQALAAGPNTPMGMLIGAFSHRKVDNSLSWADENQIFSYRSMYLGGTTSNNYVTISPIDGWLYLLMNDGDGYFDNNGSISVQVTLSAS